MSTVELEQHIASLPALQDNRCTLTRIAFQFHGPDADKIVLPSFDRIDSAGHSRRTISKSAASLWKGNGHNEDFKQLLMKVRGGGQGPSADGSKTR